tara:strand:- start:793 stop:1248 length:456 start_codon:yes stop_codon:yes gene_type:complete
MGTNEEDAPFKLRNTIAGMSIEKTKKIQRYLETARNIANQSNYGKIKHGAILVKGGSIIHASCNKGNFSAFGSRFRKQGRGPATHHAELGCITGVPRAVSTGADVYVCRVNRHGEYRSSKPCNMCHDVLKHVGVKRVYYTTDEGSVRMYKL